MEARGPVNPGTDLSAGHTLSPPQCSTKLGWYRADLLALDAVIGMGADGRRARALELQGVREREAREREAQEREQEAREREQCFAALRQAAADLDARVPSAD